MGMFANVRWLWTLPHPYPRPWAWTVFVGFVALSIILRREALFAAAINAHLLAELIFCYRELPSLKARHRLERREGKASHTEGCARCRSLKTQRSSHDQECQQRKLLVAWPLRRMPEPLPQLTGPYPTREECAPSLQGGASSIPLFRKWSI